jgi:hypothetical protein
MSLVLFEVDCDEALVPVQVDVVGSVVVLADSGHVIRNLNAGHRGAILSELADGVRAGPRYR